MCLLARHLHLTLAESQCRLSVFVLKMPGAEFCIQSFHGCSAGHLSPAEKAWIKQDVGPGLKRASGTEVWQRHNHDVPANVLESCNRSGQCKDQRTAKAVVAAHDHECRGAGTPLAVFLAERVQHLQEADQQARLQTNPRQVRFSGRQLLKHSSGHFAIASLQSC